MALELDSGSRLLKKFQQAIESAFEEEAEKLAQEYADRIKAKLKAKAAEYAVNISQYMRIDCLEREMRIVITEGKPNER